MRNPKDRKDKELYRVYFKEVPTFIIHEDIVKTGKENFGSTFHWSEKMTRKVRPFEIKPAHREVCACIYHLRWDLFAEALHNFRKKIASRRPATASNPPTHPPTHQLQLFTIRFLQHLDREL